MASVRCRRFQLDLQEFITRAPDSIILLEYDEASSLWIKFVVQGPPGTAFESGVFHVEVNVPQNFPFAAPEATFVTPIFHPNIGSNGVVCVDILSDWQKSGRTLLHIAEAMQGLLADPNPFSPLNSDAADMMKEGITVFNNTVTMWTCIFAEGSKPRPADMERKIKEVMDKGIDEETALRRLSQCSWEVNDAINMRRNRH